MGPGDLNPGHHLTPPKFLPEEDKLKWRKDVRCWAKTIQACSEGGDTKAKGMLSALGMILFRSLPTSRQEIIEKSIRTGEFTLDPSDPAYPKNSMDVIDSIINLVAKDSPMDAIKRLAQLNKAASTCVRRHKEPTSSFLERYILPAQTYLNLINADKSSAESQNLAMTLLSNANLPPETFSSVMASLVMATKSRSSDLNAPISLDKNRVELTIKVLESTLKNGNIDELKDEAQECVKKLKLAQSRQLKSGLDSSLQCYISLTDAMTALEEATMDQSDIQRHEALNKDVEAKALLAHTSLVRRFQNHKQNSDPNWGRPERFDLRKQYRSNRVKQYSSFKPSSRRGLGIASDTRKRSFQARHINVEDQNCPEKSGSASPKENYFQ